MLQSYLKKGKLIFLFVFLQIIAYGQKPVAQIPSAAQLQWHNDEYYLFIHFGPNTFTDLEWGKGTEHAEVFIPEKLDTRQWCRIAKQAGAAGIIITGKHHDGFCLWPSKYSTHTVRESKWKNGKGDVLKELSQSCKEFNLKFGVYLSPWDRNHPNYGTPEYNHVFVNMMTELFTNYGPIWEFWWDGANGEGLNGKKQEYDWPLFRQTIKKLSPSTVVFSDVGPDIRWVGNENGIAGTTNWNTLNITGFTPGEGAPKQFVLNTGDEDGEQWIPAECDVSIRPGWFFHKQENEKVKSPEQLFNLYLKSVGRGANLLLNVPPDQNGLFTAFDSSALLGFKKLRDQNFKKNIIKGTSVTVDKKQTTNLTDNQTVTTATLQLNGTVEITMPAATSINCIQLSEDLAQGQRVKKFIIQLLNEKDELLDEIKATTIGHKRILTFKSNLVKKIVVKIVEAKAPAILSEVAVFKIDEALIEK